jgi:HEPN domain-containing protein
MASKAPKFIRIDRPFIVLSKEADYDYLLARLISFLGGGFHSKAGFFAQQACEKYMKALNIQRNGTYLETHKLLDLAAKCEPDGAFFSEPETKRILEQFDIFDQIGRYGAAANFDPLSKGASVGGVSIKVSPGVEIAGAWIWTPKHLHDLDGFVFQARALLDFEKIKWDDGLKSVMSNNQRSQLVSRWQFPIPLREVLTKQNAYFKA